MLRTSLAAFLAGVVLILGPPAAPGQPAGEGPARSPAVEKGIQDLQLIRPAGNPRQRDFLLPTLGGPDFRLAEHRGKAVLVNFWATWCVPCREEMPALERLGRRLAARPFAIIAVSQDRNPALVAPFVAEHRIGLPVALDDKTRVGRTFGARALPVTAIIDRDGYLAALAFGPRPWDGKAAIALLEALME